MKWLYIQRARSQSVVNIAFHPFSFTHHITYSDIFSYNSYTDIHIIYLVFVLFYSLFVYFMCIYDSIHVLIVYVLFKAISLFIEFILSIRSYKVLCLVFSPHLKVDEPRGPGERVSGESGGNYTTD